MQNPTPPTSAPTSPPAKAPAPSGPLALVTAGPTEEPVDEVRFLGNRSSGRLGIAVAAAFADLGTRVVLALGPIRSPAPADLLSSPYVRVERFRTAAELKALLTRELPAADIVVMAAAVADFRPSASQSGKLRRGESMALQLEPVEDLLSATRGSRKAGACVIGFALEPQERLERSALDKLSRKDLDAIVANPLETMDAPDIDATLYFRDGRARRAAAPGVAVPKEAFGRWLAAQAIELANPA